MKLRKCKANECYCNHEGLCVSKELFGVEPCKKNYTNKDLIEGEEHE